eukprot:CAMPEP_0184448504 /NCGR_PEP_ID=MMETSP0740-20130409/4443_1 /TAXON_ID=385413 /ORGANISM="Thalassiosira miniscula, Strain CCMP1093" /LENGTH=154 /DNA_ID=CAMNT_0026818417 /DNA_START=133 /DNA_END=595 /DNA_ORIENTATION=-
MGMFSKKRKLPPPKIFLASEPIKHTSIQSPNAYKWDIPPSAPTTDQCTPYETYESTVSFSQSPPPDTVPNTPNTAAVAAVAARPLVGEDATIHRSPPTFDSDTSVSPPPGPDVREDRSHRRTVLLHEGVEPVVVIPVEVAAVGQMPQRVRADGP